MSNSQIAKILAVKRRKANFLSQPSKNGELVFSKHT